MATTTRNEDTVIEYLERLRADFAALSDTVKSLASESAANAQSQVTDAANRVNRGATAAGNRMYKYATHLGHDAAESASAATDQLEAQIARNPLATVLGALAIGFAIGALTRRQ